MTSEEIQREYSLEYWDEGGYQGLEEKEISKMLIKFAQYHVEKALKSAAEKAELKLEEYSDDWYINDSSILNSYPLENIK